MRRVLHDTSDDNGLKLRRQQTRLPDEGVRRDHSVGSVRYRKAKIRLIVKVAIEQVASTGTNCVELNLGLRFQNMLDSYIQSETKDENSKDVELFGVTFIIRTRTI